MKKAIALKPVFVEAHNNLGSYIRIYNDAEASYYSFDA